MSDCSNMKEAQAKKRLQYLAEKAKEPESTVRTVEEINQELKMQRERKRDWTA